MTGQEVGPDDVEPLTWVYYEMGKEHTAIAYLDAITEAHGGRAGRVLVQRSSETESGFDLLLTPTMAEPPPEIGDVVGTADDPWHGMARATPFATYCRAVQRDRSAGDVGAAVLGGVARPADRRAARRGPRPRGPAPPRRRAARVGAAVGGPPATRARLSSTMGDALADLDATAQAELVRTGEASAADLVDAAIERIERIDPELGAVVLPRFDRARAEAAADLPDGPFRGVPFLTKDLRCPTEGEHQTDGMRFVKDAGFRAPTPRSSRRGSDRRVS